MTMVKQERKLKSWIKDYQAVHNILELQTQAIWVADSSQQETTEDWTHQPDTIAATAGQAIRACWQKAVLSSLQYDDKIL